MKKALERRIRRHVVGRHHRFSVVVAPGLEAECQSELAALGIDSSTDEGIDGLVMFTGRLTELYRAHLHLRTATRILLPIADFKATGFGQLTRRVAEVPWDLYLVPERPFTIRVTARRSRLWHSDAVAERVSAAVAAVLGPGAVGFGQGPAVQRLFVRILDDRVFLAVDATGEPLYKRGIKVHGGRAPLRETLAAGILMMAGFTGGGPVFDPMCGSGTFSLEAALMARQVPAGLFREFAFFYWPSFQPGRWAHEKREAHAAIQTPPDVPAIVASDRDSAACDQLVRTLAHPAFAGMVHVIQKDFFSHAPGAGMPPGLVVINPPYGRRLGGETGLGMFYSRIGTHLNTAYGGWRLAMVLPHRRLADELPFTVRCRPIPHGGLTVYAATGTVGQDRY